MSRASAEIIKFLKERGWALRKHGKGSHQLWGHGNATFVVSVSSAWDIQAIRRHIIKLEKQNESPRGMRIFRQGS